MIALIVDDSAAMRRIQQMTLEAHAGGVETAANAEQALERLRTLERCDLVITDWHMAGMGGLELVRAIRSDARLAALPVLMVTSDSMLSSVELALAAGANDFVMKPFSKEALMERINSVMSSKD